MSNSTEFHSSRNYFLKSPYFSRVENKSEIHKPLYSFIWNLRVTDRNFFGSGWDAFGLESI